MIKELVQSSINILFPCQCAACGQNGAPHPLPLCPGCMDLVIRGEAPPEASSPRIENIMSCRVYDGVIKECVTAFKYSGKLRFASVFEKLIDVSLSRPEGRPHQADVIIPVPIHPVKQHKRGFNQAEIIARMLSKNTIVPVDTRVLVKTRNTPSQTGFSRDKRLRNLRNSFAVVDRLRIVGRSVLLVDDVTTSGATLEECARVLSRAGASRISAFTIARTL